MTPENAPAPQGGWRALMEGALAVWGLKLGEGEWELLGRYMEDVLQYNEKVNLTAARERREIARRHLLDGLAPVGELRRRLGPSPRLADLGAGGGFVGFCVKIAWPEADMTLIESSSRKFSFLNLEALRLGLPGLHVRNERGGRAAPFGKGKRPPSGGAGRPAVPVALGKDVGGRPGDGAPLRAESGKTYDAVLARAVAPLEDLLPEAFPLLKEGGLLMAYAGTPAPHSVDPVLARLKGSREGSRAYRLPGEERERYLLFFRRS